LDSSRYDEGYSVWIDEELAQQELGYLKQKGADFKLSILVLGVIKGVE
jgi:hypothetical protein